MAPTIGLQVVPLGQKPVSQAGANAGPHGGGAGWQLHAPLESMAQLPVAHVPPQVPLASKPQGGGKQWHPVGVV